MLVWMGKTCFKLTYTLFIIIQQHQTQGVQTNQRQRLGYRPSILDQHGRSAQTCGPFGHGKREPLSSKATANDWTAMMMVVLYTELIKKKIRLINSAVSVIPCITTLTEIAIVLR